MQTNRVSQITSTSREAITFPSRSRWVEYFRYLDELRESGIINMWGASLYIASEFSLDDKTARKILMTWMDYFQRDVDPIERVDIYLQKEVYNARIEP